MTTALISLGSNLGDRKATLDAAVHKLGQTEGIEAVVVSSYHETQPIGGPVGQTAFINAAAKLPTSLSPCQLLTQLQRIEHELGRDRQEHWGPRTLDLDLLLYGQEIISEPDLIVPHRFLPFRRFVLEPAVKVAGKIVHPQLGLKLKTILERLNYYPQVYEVGGLSRTIRREFAQRIASHFGLAIAQREVVVHAETGQAQVKTAFRTHDGKPLDTPPHNNFIAEDSYGELIYRPAILEPLRWSQLKEDLLSGWGASFPSVALFQLDAADDWLIGADPSLAQPGDDAAEYCNEFRMMAERARHALHLAKLDLPADDLDRAVREAVAAIQAMQ